MQSKKIIAVVGGTGAQGSGLVHAILNDPSKEFTARVLTRDVNSEKAKEYAKLGAEVVSADNFNLESLKQALDGAYGAYFVTPLDFSNPEKEKEQAQNFAQAAKDTGIQHAIFSTLEDTRQWIPLSDPRMPTLHEKYKVPHFDVKGESNKFFTDLGVPTTFLLTSFYFENFIFFGMGAKKNENGELAITLPMADKKLAGIATDDIGKCAFGIFKRGPEFIGKTVGLSSDKLTVQEMADEFTKALGQKVVYNQISHDVYRSFGFPGADDIGNMFQFYVDCADDFLGHRSIELSKELNPELQSFETWLAANVKRIPIN